MSDRELLELAAKAFGFGAPETGATCWTGSEYPRGSGMHGALWNYVGHMDTAKLWNAASCDGDSFRLQVKLHIDLSINNGEARATWVDLDASETHHVTVPCDEYFEGMEKKYAGARRAVLLAAAEIGRRMP